MNQNRYNKERIVTIKGIWHLMSSYRRWILPFILLLALLSGGFQVVKLHRNILSYRNKPATVEKQIKVDEAEFYMVKSVVETEEIVQEKQAYLDQSILMQIDPLHKKYGTLRYVFSFDDYEVHNN
ncbi:MAG: hypothetical protein J6P60_02715, partial [Lachnospiraceae bacterium]|nr:hypothetical protein [Lachnospiraceae bacterium]